jgi:uncharacterized protein
MKIKYLFLNNQGDLRSGWRVWIFILISIFFLILLSSIEHILVSIIHRGSSDSILQFHQKHGFLIQSIIIFITATIVGLWSTRILDRLPLTALGIFPHRGWIKHWLIGIAVGTGSILIAITINLLLQNASISFNGFSVGVLKTLLFSGLIFLVGAAAEEMLFRGYPLQTLLRSIPAWIAIALPSIFFAFAHLNNPNVKSPTIIFINTALAGIWLSIAYYRSRSLWFPFGIHWAWNWTTGAIIGLPVSGITDITPDPILQYTNNGPIWFTGGQYGIEAGLSGTIALLISTIFIWKTGLISAARKEEIENKREEFHSE